MSAFDPNFPADNQVAYADEQRAQFNALNNQDTATNQRIDNLPPPAPGPKGDKGDPGDSIVGPTGPAGADGRSFNPRGEFDSMQSYNRLDLVSYSGLSYVCGEDGLAGVSPGMDSRWTQIQVSGGGDPFPYNGNPEINGNIKNNGTTYTNAVGIGVSDIGGSGEFGVIHGTDTSSGIPLPLIAIRNSGMTPFQIVQDLGGMVDGMGTPTIQDGSIWRYDAMSGRMKPWNVTVQTINYMDSSGNPATMQVIVPPP